MLIEHGAVAAGLPVVAGHSFLCGLFGSGVAHSASPRIHEAEAAALGLQLVYRTIDFESLGLSGGDLAEMLTAAQRMGFNGLNVTHPYKQQVIPLLDTISDEARTINSVNTVVFSRGRRSGFSTDGAGFIANLRRNLPDISLRNVLQIGAGGAGCAIAYALLEAGTGRLLVHDIDAARTAHLTEKLAATFGSARVAACSSPGEAMATVDGVVQTSPVGMEGHIGLPLPVEWLRPQIWVADIVYFPRDTELLKAARARGCRTVGGEGMLVLQAAASFRLFTGVEPDPERMLRSFSPAF